MNLMAHQLKAVQIAQRHPRYAFFWDPGAGKTIAILAIIDDTRAQGRPLKTLVLAPKSILRAAWAADAAHFPRLKVVVCWSDKPAERRRLISTPGADVLVTNYETFRKHAKDFLAAGVRRLVIDESSKVKAHDSQISKAAALFSDGMDSVYLLSGTPAPNNPTEYWSQMRCVDPALFGRSFYRFAYDFFSPVKRMIGTKERIIGWRPMAHKQEEFAERLSRASWSLRKSDCLDLPPQSDVIRPVDLSPGETSAYLSMLEEFKVEMRDGSTLNAAAQAVLMKLRQITGGGIYVDGVSRPLGTSKLDALADVLDELGSRPTVIWAEFTAEINRIVALCAARGESVAVIDGQTPMPARESAIASFQAGGLQRLVCHPAAAGHGVTLTAACYDIFYSHSFSFEAFEQARNRIHRTGQKERVTHYHLLARGTVDERVWWALKNKKNGHEAVMSLLSQEATAA